MPQKIGLPALKLTRPKVPKVPLRSRAFELAGRKIDPLSGPDIPIPEVQNEDFLARYASWRATYNGSIPEFIVWEYRTKQKRQRVGVDFDFQSPFFGGRTRFGGFIADYFFPRKNEIWRVNGERFHLAKPKDRAKDALAKVQFLQQGYTVLDLWEDDLLSRAQFVLDLAFERGVDVPTRLQL